MAIGSRLRHIVESQQFSRAILEELFARADEMKSQPHQPTIDILWGNSEAAGLVEPSYDTERFCKQYNVAPIGSKGVYVTPPGTMRDPPPPSLRLCRDCVPRWMKTSLVNARRLEPWMKARTDCSRARRN